MQRRHSPPPGSPPLDLFFNGLVRGCSQAKLDSLLTASWQTDPQLTLQLIAHSRDCRGGKGERLVSLHSLLYLRSHKPLTYLANLLLYLSCGYFKDLLQLARMVEEAGGEKLGETELIELEVMAEFLRYDAAQMDHRGRREKQKGARTDEKEDKKGKDEKDAKSEENGKDGRDEKDEKAEATDKDEDDEDGDDDEYVLVEEVNKRTATNSDEKDGKDEKDEKMTDQTTNTQSAPDSQPTTAPSPSPRADAALVRQYPPVPTSAVALLLPQALWPALQSIREKNDPAFTRWPPHINLLYGFVSEDRLADACDVLRGRLCTARSVHRIARLAATVPSWQVDQRVCGRQGQGQQCEAAAESTAGRLPTLPRAGLTVAQRLHAPLHGSQGAPQRQRQCEGVVGSRLDVGQAAVRCGSSRCARPEWR